MVQTLEGTAFSINKFYDGLNYFTTADKLKNCQGGLKWQTLTRSRPFRTHRFFIRPKTKRMVPYSHFGIRVGVPAAGAKYQLVSAADTTNVTHVYANLRVRYNEWHQNFNFQRV